MGRQAFDQATALDPANRRAPPVPGKCIGRPGTKRVGGIGPQVLAVVLARDILLIIEGLHRHRVRAIGQTAQHVRQRQADIA
ncbi:hypothetical protein D3C79_968320 [compost metagenome]